MGGGKLSYEELVRSSNMRRNGDSYGDVWEGLGRVNVAGRLTDEPKGGSGVLVRHGRGQETRGSLESRLAWTGRGGREVPYGEHGWVDFGVGGVVEVQDRRGIAWCMAG